MALPCFLVLSLQEMLANGSSISKSSQEQVLFSSGLLALIVRTRKFYHDYFTSSFFPVAAGIRGGARVCASIRCAGGAGG
jgi:hypothetical protein